jgi:hypothetical protein
MSTNEKQILRTIIGTLADRRGNWQYAWRVLCEMAEADPEQIPPPFADAHLAAVIKENVKVEAAKKSQQRI